jgi:type IV secretory pathway TrbD component
VGAAENRIDQMQTIYSSLTRAKLRNGCDSTLNALNVLLCVAFGLTLLHHLTRMWIPIALYYILRTVFRWCAAHDPQWLGVYTDALKLRRVFLAHADPDARDKRPKRVLFKLPKWSV